jgi:hypothetical protein
MTKRSTGNRQKKVVAARAARGGERRPKVTIPRTPPVPRRDESAQSTPRSGREEDASRE